MYRTLMCTVQTCGKHYRRSREKWNMLGQLSPRCMKCPGGKVINQVYYHVSMRGGFCYLGGAVYMSCSGPSGAHWEGYQSCITCHVRTQWRPLGRHQGRTLKVPQVAPVGGVQCSALDGGILVMDRCLQLKPGSQCRRWSSRKRKRRRL